MAKGNGLSHPRVDYEKEYEIERDLDSLCRAEAVKKDPKRMEACRKMAKSRLEENKARRDQHQKMVDMGEGKNP
jgi:hypothetical protein